MEHIKIKIQTKEDAINQIMVMPELKNKKVVTAKTVTVCIMEDMTQGHKAGVSFVLEHEDGTFSTHIMTKNIFNGVISSYKGALQRFKDLEKAR